MLGWQRSNSDFMLELQLGRNFDKIYFKILLERTKNQNIDYNSKNNVILIFYRIGISIHLDFVIILELTTIETWNKLKRVLFSFLIKLQSWQ